jgi:hypothetical protein
MIEELEIYNLNDKIQQYRDGWLSQTEWIANVIHQDMHGNTALELAYGWRDGHNKFLNLTVDQWQWC